MEEDRIHYFLSVMHGDELQTFKKINNPSRDNLAEILAVIRKNYVKPQSTATAKHIFQRLVSTPADQKLNDFMHKLQKLAEKHSDLVPQR